jgi:hypothetical protein
LAAIAATYPQGDSHTGRFCLPLFPELRSIFLITSSFLYDGTNWTPVNYPAPGFVFTQVEGIDDNRIVGWYQDSMGQHGFLTELDTIPSDSNNDGTADAADYAMWRKTGGPLGDYNIWRTGVAWNGGRRP